jgi:hypothetical protein
MRAKFELHLKGFDESKLTADRSTAAHSASIQHSIDAAQRRSHTRKRLGNDGG